MVVRGKELSVFASGFRFSNSNYDNWNTNTNVSSHLCEITAAQTMPTGQNMIGNDKSVGSASENDLKKAKA